LTADVAMLLKDKELLAADLKMQEKLCSEAHIENMTLVNKYDKTAKQFEETRANLVADGEQLKQRIEELGAARERELEQQASDYDARLGEIRNGMTALEDEVARQSQTIEEQ
jgi:hypothetical protein